ncbi:TPM domain-containing protein [Salinicoccus hispanicus]|uniref:TPM domain-containing protein n=1 Tax=Salinicoccus hispanicus TaxID=157225 RepID=A0A6N8TZL4_9STAP|nr:TPM domain-containing protein [Salinicoccus hispanicus]MXQ50497.1 TPM domain-containing protein [Salinicoccus hispanicus]
MKRLVTLMLILFVFSSVPAEARVALPTLDTSHYFVQDNAGVLSDTAVQEINEMGTYLEEGTGVEMLLLTMSSTGQEHRQDYALKALREYGIGKSEADNGIVILLNLDNGNEYNNRGVEVQVGYGIEGYLNDAKIGRIIDNVAMEDFIAATEAEDGSADAAAHYAQGLSDLYAALYQESLEAYGYEDGEFTRDTPEADENMQSAEGENTSAGGSIFRLLFMMAVIYLLFKIMGGGGRPPRGGGRRRRRGGPVVFFPPSGGGSRGGGFGGGGFGGFGGGSGGGGGAGRGF